jgi:hypothetical protein
MEHVSWKFVVAPIPQQLTSNLKLIGTTVHAFTEFLDVQIDMLQTMTLEPILMTVHASFQFQGVLILQL